MRRVPLSQETAFGLPERDVAGRDGRAFCAGRDAVDHVGSSWPGCCLSLCFLLRLVFVHLLFYGRSMQAGLFYLYWLLIARGSRCD